MRLNSPCAKSNTKKPHYITCSPSSTPRSPGVPFPCWSFPVRSSWPGLPRLLIPGVFLMECKALGCSGRLEPPDPFRKGTGGDVSGSIILTHTRMERKRPKGNSSTPRASWKPGVQLCFQVLLFPGHWLPLALGQERKEREGARILPTHPTNRKQQPHSMIPGFYIKTRAVSGGRGAGPGTCQGPGTSTWATSPPKMGM